MVARRPFRLVLVAGFVAAAIPAGTASAKPSDLPSAGCAAQPLPAGCVSAIRYVDPSTIQMTRHADGSVSGTWSPDAPGVTVALPAPVPAADAAAIAQGQAAARGLAFDLGNPATAARLAARPIAHRSQTFTTYCSYHADTPYWVAIDSYWRHMHSKSHQYCDRTATTHAIYTENVRDSTGPLGQDSALAYGGNQADTDAWISCHSAGEHSWWNYSDFTATVAGTLRQGPLGYFAVVTKRCY